MLTQVAYKFNNMKISAKKKDELYNIVSEEITQARLQIKKLNISDKFVEDNIDKILFNLQCGASQKAISCFDYPKDR